MERTLELMLDVGGSRLGAEREEEIREGGRASHAPPPKKESRGQPTRANQPLSVLPNVEIS